ncbi:MAG: FISUMP domain-containing protein [Saccharofermentanales bacterium]
MKLMFNNKLLRTQSGKILTYVQPCVVMPDGCAISTTIHPRWNANAAHYGTNNFGFNAFAGGYRFSSGSFGTIGINGLWWSATELSTNSVWSRSMSYGNGIVYRGDNNKELGFSVRCVKDYTGSQPNGTILSNDYTDGEGNTYDAVVIGNQLWTVENLKTTKYQNGTNIPNVTNNTDWRNLTTGAYCWYNNDYNTWGVHYGALYNWYAMDGLVDNNGYRVPSDSDWTQLTDYLIGINWCNGVVVNETNVGQYLKSCRQVNHPIVINSNTRVYDRTLQFYPDDPYEYYKINGVPYLNNYGTYFIDEENPIGQGLTEGYTFNYNYNAGDTIELLRTQMSLIINGVGKLDSGNGSTPSPWVYTMTESDVENGIYVNIFDYVV